MSLRRALELAHASRLTVYDALFVAVAESYDAVLITADGKLARKARELGLTGEDT